MKILMITSVSMALMAYETEAVVLVDTGTPHPLTRGGNTITNRVVADNFILAERALVNSAEFYLILSEDEFRLIDLDVLFYDGTPGFTAVPIYESAGLVDSINLQHEILGSVGNVYRVNLSFEGILLDSQQYWFGLRTNNSRAGIASTQLPGDDRTLYQEFYQDAQGEPREVWTNGGDGSLAFSLSGTVVPEPSSLVMLAVGLPVLLRRRRC